MTEITDIRDTLERMLELLAEINAHMDNIEALLDCGVQPAEPETFVEWAEPENPGLVFKDCWIVPGKDQP